jgi:hypothetical protein
MSRLINPEALAKLECFVGFHLGEQHHSLIDINNAKSCSEADRMLFLPQIFGLMPVEATIREVPYMEVKPFIIAHLTAIGAPVRDTLVNIIKDLCDNFDRTKWREGEVRSRARKASIGDLRQQPELYRRIRDRQGARCAVCGTLFGARGQEETLDHVIPWRLGGDPPGGWNWQLLCRRCNGAKDTLFSAFATSEYVNWIFSDLTSVKGTAQINYLSEKGRYLALAHYKSCRHPGCGATSVSGNLYVKKRTRTGFAIFDHLTVLCSQHLDCCDGPVIG